MCVIFTNGLMKYVDIEKVHIIVINMHITYITITDKVKRRNLHYKFSPKIIIIINITLIDTSSMHNNIIKTLIPQTFIL